MQIVSIFEGSLYAVRFDGEEDDELTRLLELWNDAEYLNKFYEKNREILKVNPTTFLSEIQANVLVIIKDFKYLKENINEIDNFFEPLSENERRTRFLRTKRRQYVLEHIGLRLYALQIENGCYMITGGAIKITKTMQEH